MDGITLTIDPARERMVFFDMANLLRSDPIVYGTLFGAIAIAIVVLVMYFRLRRENSRLQLKIEHIATTDALTGITNRRYFEETLAREIKRAQRYGRQLTLLMIDIDKFRNYNDRHGRPMGDQLLRDCAHLMRALLRASDLVARYGGDEFAVLLPEITAKQGKSVADKLRKIRIGSLASKEEIAMAIGCAAYKKDMTAETLLALADKDMQKQKAAAARK